eukprot:3559658-Rhodomonas_salina.1
MQWMWHHRVSGHGSTKAGSIGEPTASTSLHSGHFEPHSMEAKTGTPCSAMRTRSVRRMYRRQRSREAARKGLVKSRAM